MKRTMMRAGLLWISSIIFCITAQGFSPGQMEEIDRDLLSINCIFPLYPSAEVLGRYAKTDMARSF
jgi:hypothetical protein